MIVKVTKFVVSTADPDFPIWDEFFREAEFHVQETATSFIYSKEEILEGCVIKEESENA